MSAITQIAKLALDPSSRWENIPIQKEVGYLKEGKMRISGKALFNLTAADLMNEEVETIPPWMTLPAAARTLARSHISGAPVVNTEGECVGVISTTDFMTWAEKGEPPDKKSTAAEVCFPWQIVDEDNFTANSVRGHMTADPVTVRSNVSIGELAQKMVDAHIHRLIVVNEENKPIGVISSTDILAALANAVNSKRQLERRS
jgi:CBS domain-containing protein